MRKRDEKFDGVDCGVIVSAAPLFSEKARLDGAVKFSLGADADGIIVSTNYYENGGLIQALMRGLGRARTWE